MKKILKFGLVLVLVLTAMNVQAAEVDFSLNVKKGQGKMVTFVLDKMDNIELSIYDANKVLIYSEKVKSKESINRTYDLNSLPEGTYFLEAESELKIATYKIAVIGETATLEEAAVSVVYKPVFVNDKGLVSLSVFNFEKEAVTIKIYNEDEVELFSETTSEEYVGKFFDIKMLPNDKFTFVVSYANNTMIKTISAVE